MKSTQTKYGRVAQAFHWTGALLILTLFPLGVAMTRMPGGGTKAALYSAHVWIGLLVSALTVARVVWRVLEPTPAAPGGMSPLQRLAFHGIHVLLYVLLLALSVSGVAMLLATGNLPWAGPIDPAGIARDLPPRVGHDIVSKVYLALLVAHVGAAMLYQRTKGDVMRRMGLALGGPRSSAQSR